MAVANLPAGHVPTAAELAEWRDAINRLIGPPFARLTGTFSHPVSNTTLANVTGLAVAALANKVYKVDLRFNYDGSTTGDLKYDITLPAGATLLSWKSYGLDAADAGTTGSVYRAVALFPSVHGALGAGSPLVVDANGLLVMSSTAGSVQVRIAQSASSATATRLFTGTYLHLQEVA